MKMNCETHMVPHRAGESGQATLELAAILVGIIAMAVGFLFVAGLSLSDNRTLLEAKKSAEWNARNGGNIRESAGELTGWVYGETTIGRENIVVPFSSRDRSGNTLDSQLKTAGDAFQSASSSEPDARYPYDYRWISPRTFDSGFGADFVSSLSNGYNAAKLVRGSGSTENSPVFSFDESGLLEGGRYIDNTRTRARTRAAMRDTFHQWFGIRIRQNQLTDSPANQVYMPSGNHED